MLRNEPFEPAEILKWYDAEVKFANTAIIRGHRYRRYARRWKTKAKAQRAELARWRSGDYFLHRDKWTPTMRQAYRRPWWSGAEPGE